MALPISEEQIKKTREFFTQQREAFNAIIADPGLDEPLRGQFMALKGQYDSLLESMPLTEAVPAAQQANWNLSALYNCLISAQNMMGLFRQGLDGMKTRSAQYAEKVKEALNSIPGEVDKAINAKVAAGELVPKTALNSDYVLKATVAELCDAAKKDGEAAGLAKAQTEFAAKETRMKLVAERTKLVQTCGLPVPEADDLLADEPAKFDVTLATAKTRLELLKTKRIAENGVIAKKVWADEATWKDTEAIVTSMVRPGAPEPLLGGGGTAGDKPRLGAI